jgi:hypothetical protein
MRAAMDALTKSYNKALYSLYKESHKKSMINYHEKQLNTDVDEQHKCCTRCYKIQPISNFGERMDSVRIDGTNQEAMVPYRSCVACRERDKRRLTKKISVL